MYFSISHPLPLQLRITVKGPEALFELMRIALCGWDVHRVDANSEPLIEIVDEGKLSVVTSSFRSARAHSDLINTLNNTLIALAYCVRDLKPHSMLLHAAALKSSNGISVYFGPRKSGKSRYVAEQCLNGAVCIGDDLILYCKKSRLFEALGLPVRLRRPIPSSILGKIDASRILVGHSTCYLTEHVFSLMPAGQRFQPDRLFQLQPEYRVRALPMAKLGQFLDQSIIQ